MEATSKLGFVWAKAAVAVRRSGRGFFKKVARNIPLFTYLFFVYLIIKVASVDVRSVLFSIGGYELTLVEILYVAGTLIGMGELIRVSAPGIDNSKEVLEMILVSILYLIVFVLGAAEVEWFQIFSNTEFLVLMIMSFGQSAIGQIINSRTLKRTIDYTGDNDHHH